MSLSGLACFVAVFLVPMLALVILAASMLAGMPQ